MVELGPPLRYIVDVEHAPEDLLNLADVFADTDLCFCLGAYTLRHTYTFLMLSAGKPLQWVADQLGHVGVKKIDEVYGRWKQRQKLPDKQLDLEKVFRSIRALPVGAVTEMGSDRRHANEELSG